jgi:hypothetical protein
MARRIGSGKVAFFRFELERGDAKRKKVALQELCSLYRRGFVLSAEQATDFETIINGILLQDKQMRSPSSGILGIPEYTLRRLLRSLPASPR